MSNCYHACLIVALFFLSPPYTHSLGGRTVKRRVLGFVCYLHQHFLQGEKFPVVLLHTSHSHFFHSLILWVFSWSGHRYVGSRHFILYIGKLLLLLLFFPTLQSPILLSSSSTISQQFLSAKQLPLPICFPHQMHALSLDWEVSGAGTVSRLIYLYGYLSSKSPSSKPQSPITVTNAAVGEKALIC